MTAITQTQINNLRATLDSGDRGGFYLKLAWFITFSCILMFAPFAFLGSASANGADSFRQFYPTPKEIAEDCKVAIKLAEAKDYKAFMRTACVARIHAITATYVILLQMIDLPTDPDTPIIKKTLEKQAKRICFPDSSNDDPPLAELRMARDYVKLIQEYKGLNEERLEEPSAMPMLDMLQSSCKIVR